MCRYRASVDLRTMCTPSRRTHNCYADAELVRKKADTTRRVWRLQEKRNPHHFTIVIGNVGLADVLQKYLSAGWRFVMSSVFSDESFDQ